MMVMGLKTVPDLVMMLTSANQVREEFGMWIDDKIYKQLMQVAADLESWATTRNLAIATAELIDFRQQIIVQLFNNHLKINLSICAEIKSAWESSIYGEFQKSDVAWVTVLFPDA
ncbi:hypothetical protein [Nostoc sp.]|uniref:hypothetical protein n=1 Tax=Nostoc sp. TaxID=1180 RepID=UPI002FF520E0